MSHSLWGTDRLVSPTSGGRRAHVRTKARACVLPERGVGGRDYPEQVVTALYRRYRPENFAELIGQTQVTDPLMSALRSNRVSHAYLFSGPRGCGKTTSARILARCLNCAEGPTDTPCGVCPSCVELSRDGSGSLDVVEIDAASHNGVDDARDLRERAIFAPARDRYKVFILDEAHMVTPQGFNALLKIVEEPPEHVKFIFATTEPEKVIGTIRSRTHHYPFRLVPPAQMLDYVQQLCDTESVVVAPGVLPLVVRAGGGSVRDTLSLLDQLINGSDGPNLDYSRAVALLGYTHGALLDDVIDSLAAQDAGGAFAAVDRVIQTGQDPRRFVEDLLERLRDLIIVAATSAEGAAAVLCGVPQDELDAMQVQSSKFGASELSRAADVANAALTEMTGATSPRLHLELMIARVLVPASDDTHRGALARVERLERRVGVASAGEPAPVATSVPEPVEGSASVPEPAEGSRSSGAQIPNPIPVTSPEPVRGSVATAPVPVTIQQLKDAWPQIEATVQKAKRSAWMVAVTATPRSLTENNVLTLSFPSQNDVDSFKQAGASGDGVSDFLRAAILEVLGIRVRFIARPDGPPPSPAPADPAHAPNAPNAPGSSNPSTPTGVSTGSSGQGDATAGGSSGAPGAPGASGASGVPNAQGASGTAQSQSSTRPTGAPAASVVPGTSAASGGWVTVAIPNGTASDAPSAAPSGGVGAGNHSATTQARNTSAVGAPTAASSSASVPAPSGAPFAPTDLEPPEPDEPEPDWTREPDPSDDAPAAVVNPPESPVTVSPSAPTSGTAPTPARGTSPATSRSAQSSPPDGPQRYGESVVREILGASFIEEKPVTRAARPTIRPTGDGG